METKTQDLGDEFLRQARAREYLGKYRRQPSDVRLLVALPAARSAHVPQIRFRAYVNVAMNRGAGSEKERVQAAFLVFDCFIERATMLVFDVEPGTYDNGATVDDLREAVAALEEMARISRRVFGGAHPTTIWVEGALVHARMALRIRRACSLLSGPLVFAFAVAAFAWVWRKYRS